MPTGLTAKIYEGEETSLREFALTCVANFNEKGPRRKQEVMVYNYTIYPGLFDE